ncbi:MAG: ABC transporter substrate-binding protein [Oscillospiraceae bacterium]|nr:ABC transporter substrate-binding protein [Oscillospiraceae bacterium]MDY6208102.1 ABC transporter substrate-binding protein [Oscillospiraceae bacterium]
MFKKKLIFLSAVMLMLTSCASEPVVIEQEEYTDISLSWWGNDTRTEYTLAAVKEFERLHPDIRVKCSYSEWSGYQTRYNIQMMSDTESDVMLINFPWLDKYSADGSGYYDIYELSEFVDLSQFSESELSFGIRNGKLSAVPIALNTQTVYYNKTVYDRYELALPETWDDLFNAAKVMGDRVYPIAMPSKSAMFFITAYTEQQSGKSFMSENGQLGFGREELGIMLDFYVKLVNSHVIPQVEYFDKNAIRNGTYAGAVAWLSDAENYMGPAREDGNEIVVGSYTGCTDGVKGWYTKPATLYAVSAETEHPEESALLLDFLLNSNEISELQGIEKGIPLSRSSRDYLEQNDMLKGLHYDAFKLMSANIDSMALIDPFMENTDMLDAFQEACNAVLYGKATTEEKSAELYEQFNSILNG